MRAPAFWYAPPGPASALLAPLGRAYAAASAWRRRQIRPERVGIPVVCVGNLVAGGAGKTPVALVLADILRDEGLTVHFLTRGYGGREPGPVRVDPGRHGPADVGDEALLLAAVAPTWVARDRVAGARAALAAGADMVVMDDGYQNPRLARDLNLLVIDGGSGFGNGRVLPAGPLRESVASGLARADAVVLIGEDRQGVAATLDRPVLRARLLPDPEIATALRGRRVAAFAGIGRPEKFFGTLRDLGADVAVALAFADHHPYRAADVARIERSAAGLPLVTTAKDAVRLPSALRARVTVLPVRLYWDEPDAVRRLLIERTARAA